MKWDLDIIPMLLELLVLVDSLRHRVETTVQPRDLTYNSWRQGASDYTSQGNTLVSWARLLLLVVVNCLLRWDKQGQQTTVSQR